MASVIFAENNPAYLLLSRGVDHVDDEQCWIAYPSLVAAIAAANNEVDELVLIAVTSRRQ